MEESEITQTILRTRFYNNFGIIRNENMTKEF